MSDRFSLIGQTIADRYLIQELLGEGGMGRVYLAEHVRMGRKSAVKVMNPALAVAADAITRFNREAANASRINHPNVAQIYDFGETADGTLYLAMEYIEGETLADIIGREGPLPIQRAAAITRQVADALRAAHHLGIIHRDLKPENIMIARHLDGSDWVKVVDFGIAKTTQQGGGSQTVTTAGVSLGTPEYMSPEQLAGERLDPRSDVYSLGLVCFNMLTGDLPYPRLTSKETLVKRLTSRPRTLAEVRPNAQWPESLQHALDRALAPEAADRYDNVGDFGRDVSVAANDISADPDRTVRIPAPAARSAPTMPLPERSSSSRPVPSRTLRPALAIAAVVVVVIGGAWIALPRLPQRVHAAEPPQRAVVVPQGSSEAPGASLVGHQKQDVHRPSRALASSDTTPALHHAAANAALPGTAVDGAESPNRPIAGQHAWLRANGDSGAARTLAPGATIEQRLQAMRNEIEGHISRANMDVAQGQYQRARADFSAAGQELNFMHELLGNVPVIGQLRRSLVEGVRSAYQSCRADAPDPTAGPVFRNGFRCENLLPKNPNAARNFRAFGARPNP